MRRLFLIAAAVTPLLLAAGTEAMAQQRVGGHGFRAGGFHGGGGFGGWRGSSGWRGAAGWHGGTGWRGAYRGNVFPSAGAWRGGYYRPHYRRWGGYPGWGWGAGLATAATIGALTTYPAYPDYYDYPAYPAYPVYPAYEVAPAANGGQCSTPVKICTLYERAPLGIGCSCRVPGGRARGTVVGP